jgi:hypothetical protein
VFAWSNRNHLAFLRLFFGCIRDDDTSLGFLLLFDAFYDHPVVKGSDFSSHKLPPQIKRRFKMPKQVGCRKVNPTFLIVKGGKAAI